MGSVTDLFSLEENQLIRDDFTKTTFPSGTESILENKRYASTQSAATIQACDISPVNLTAIEILANSPIAEFAGATYQNLGTYILKVSTPSQTGAYKLIKQ